MDIRDIKINIESLSKLDGKIKDEILNKFAKNYSEAISQILGNISLPILFLGIGMKKAISKRFTISDALSVIPLTKKTDIEPKKMAELLVNHFEELIKKNQKDINKEIETEIDNIFTNIPEAKQYHRNIALNALTNSWTLFEAFSKDIWIYFLNNYPNNHIFNIINSHQNSDSNPEGIYGKNITLSLLSKYNFDISKNLGDILANKYDFTGVKGIKKAYTDLFQIKKNELKQLDDPNLSQLEIIRHLIVHNAGTIDTSYLKRSNRKNEKIGQQIDLSAEEFNSYFNCSIEAMKYIFLFVDKQINKS